MSCQEDLKNIRMYASGSSKSKKFISNEVSKMDMNWIKVIFSCFKFIIVDGFCFVYISIGNASISNETKWF
jgi:hypothetical protein